MAKDGIKIEGPAAKRYHDLKRYHFDWRTMTKVDPVVWAAPF